jgi:hypothetical protein
VEPPPPAIVPLGSPEPEEREADEERKQAHLQAIRHQVEAVLIPRASVKKPPLSPQTMRTGRDLRRAFTVSGRVQLRAPGQNKGTVPSADGTRVPRHSGQTVGSPRQHGIPKGSDCQFLRTLEVEALAAQSQLPGWARFSLESHQVGGAAAAAEQAAGTTSGNGLGEAKRAEYQAMRQRLTQAKQRNNDGWTAVGALKEVADAGIGQAKLQQDSFLLQQPAEHSLGIQSELSTADTLTGSGIDLNRAKLSATRGAKKPPPTPPKKPKPSAGGRRKLARHRVVSRTGARDSQRESPSSSHKIVELLLGRVAADEAAARKVTRYIPVIPRRF